MQFEKMDRNNFKQRINCEYCDKSYSCRKSYKRHLKEIHFHNILRCECNICFKTFSRKSHLRKHIRNVHRSTCDNIKVTINNENYYTENCPHLNTNTEELPNTFSENFARTDIFNDVDDDLENFLHSEEFNLPNLEQSQNCTEFRNAEQINDTMNENNSNNYVLDNEKQTIILKLETNTVNFNDGSSFVNRDATIEYSKNVEKENINITDIVHHVENEINNYLYEKQSARCYEI